VLSRPGLQVGLLRQGQGFGRGRWAAVVGLEGRRQLGAADIDRGAARRPPARQRPVDAGDLPHRPLARIAARPDREAHPEPVDQQRLEPGVVPLGRGHIALIDGPAVQRVPAAAQRGDLVADRDVGMQIRVARPRVAVGEHRRDQALHLDLSDTVGPDPGVGGVLFQPAERVGHRIGMRLLDDRRDLAGGDRPQRRDALDRAERQVKAGHSGGGLPRDPGQMPRQLPGVGRRPAVGLGEHARRDPGTDLRAHIRRHRRVRGQSQRGVVIPERARRTAVEHVRRVVRTANGRPSRLAASTSPGPRPCCRAAHSTASALGWRPCPNSARICASLTCSPRRKSGTAARPRPIQSPGASPRSL